MDCFLDFCLSCDKQTSDGLYCSQACRLADLEKAGSSAPTTPVTPSDDSLESSHWSLYHPGPGSGFYLPPAVDFTAHKTLDASATKAGPERMSGPTSPMTNSQDQPSRQTTPRQRVLSPSSSRSSLTSASGNDVAQIGQVISEQAQHELRDYFSCFDHTREMKRRSLGSIAH